MYIFNKITNMLTYKNICYMIVPIYLHMQRRLELSKFTHPKHHIQRIICIALLVSETEGRRPGPCAKVIFRVDLISWDKVLKNFSFPRSTLTGNDAVKVLEFINDFKGGSHQKSLGKWIIVQ